MTNKSSSFNLTFWSNHHFKPFERQILPSYNIPRRKIITLLGSQLIHLVGYKFPKALKALLLISSFLKIVSLPIQRARNASFILGMLKINNIMRFNLLF